MKPQLVTRVSTITFHVIALVPKENCFFAVSYTCYY